MTENDRARLVLAVLATVVIGACGLMAMWKGEFQQASFFVAMLSPSVAQFVMGDKKT